VRHKLDVAKRTHAPLARPLAEGRAVARRRRGADGGAVGPGRSPVGFRMQRPDEEFFTLVSDVGSDLAE